MVYQFVADDYTTNCIPYWTQHYSHLVGCPCRYLEIGLYEGRSMFWMLDNVLTHPSSLAVGVDPGPQPAFFENLKVTPHRNRIHFYQQSSLEFWLQRQEESLSPFDLIYVDGAHDFRNVFCDGIFAWLNLKTGGILCFDDYPWGLPEKMSFSDIPQKAIDLLLNLWRGQFTLLLKDWQVIIKKK